MVPIHNLPCDCPASLLTSAPVKLLVSLFNCSESQKNHEMAAHRVPGHPPLCRPKVQQFGATKTSHRLLRNMWEVIFF